MNQEPAPPDPGRDEDPPGVPAGPDDVPQPGSPQRQQVPSGADWPDWAADEAYLAALAEEEDPGDLEEDQDPDNAPPPGLDDAELGALIAEAREVAGTRPARTRCSPGSARPPRCRATQPAGPNDRPDSRGPLLGL